MQEKCTQVLMQICMGLSLCVWKKCWLIKSVAFVMPRTDLLLFPPWRNQDVKKQSVLLSLYFLTRPDHFGIWPKVNLIFTTDLFYSSEASAKSWVKAFSSVCLKVRHHQCQSLKHSLQCTHKWFIQSYRYLLAPSTHSCRNLLAAAQVIFTGNLSSIRGKKRINRFLFILTSFVTSLQSHERDLENR